jgi:hypothetical protein
MTTPAARVGIALAALGAAVALFFALAGGDGDSATARSQTTKATVQSQPTARSATTKSQSAHQATELAAAKPKHRIKRVWIRDGQAAGGVRRFEFKRGEFVRFSVHSAAADEVHVHGFDITKTLPANRIVLFTFKADIEGVFEVELHGAHVTIAKLRIGP